MCIGGGMNFDPVVLLIGFVFSTIGFGLFRWGRKQARLLHIGGGAVLMVVPYFCGTAMSTLLICLGLTTVLVVATRLGW